MATSDLWMQRTVRVLTREHLESSSWMERHHVEEANPGVAFRRAHARILACVEEHVNRRDQRMQRCRGWIPSATGSPGAVRGQAPSIKHG